MVVDIGVGGGSNSSRRRIIVARFYAGESAPLFIYLQQLMATPFMHGMDDLSLHVLGPDPLLSQQSTHMPR